ncbi:hypothetical protein [Allonocardiopsis opalescens]|uniref:Uncharacterized protein n=1 Tax=Allonocardiopsis opalescens TaxID=1144618 RepID=A0A2T0Q956_9ACTN|nr:hypothetical protein [Allonocardiopsis opalescens]PRY00385.1 hypothetical protein CLV72_10214 [Allonocardiopsis opalescens]
MYGFVWRILPGGLPGKLIGTLVLVGGVAALLWYVVFPWADPYLPFNDVTVEGGGPSYGGGAAGGDPSAGPESGAPSGGEGSEGGTP